MTFILVVLVLIQYSSFLKYSEVGSTEGITKRCRLSLLTNSALVIRVQMRGEGGSYEISANVYSCAHHVTWGPNKLWSSTSIFNLWIYLYENNGVGPEARHPQDGKTSIHDGNTHLKPKTTILCFDRIRNKNTVFSY